VFVSIKPGSEDLYCNIQFIMAIDNLATCSEAFITCYTESVEGAGVSCN
jgi:hypothetical protein